MSNAVAVTDADFEQQVEQNDKLTVVDFWATWCGPCRMIAPILDQLAVDYKDQVKVTKLDVDANIKTATRFNVRSIPMLLFFKGGKVVDQIVGARAAPDDRGEAEAARRLTLRRGGEARPRRCTGRRRSAHLGWHDDRRASPSFCLDARHRHRPALPESARAAAAHAAGLRPPEEPPHRREARSRGARVGLRRDLAPRGVPRPLPAARRAGERLPRTTGTAFQPIAIGARWTWCPRSRSTARSCFCEAEDEQLACMYHSQTAAPEPWPPELRSSDPSALFPYLICVHLRRHGGDRRRTAP